MWDNSFNHVVIAWVNQYATVSANLTRAINYIQGANVFKGLALMALLWYFWFRDTDKNCRTRRIIIGTIIGAFLALSITTIINYFTPFQPIPIHNEAIHFNVPIGLDVVKPAVPKHGWVNSFPSHHATMFFALATGIFLISKWAGLFAFIYVTLVIAMPRIYLGLHYPTDIVVGALVGILSIGLVNQTGMRRVYEGQSMRLMAKFPAAFQTILFMITFEMGVIFSDVLKLVKGVAKYLI